MRRTHSVYTAFSVMILAVNCYSVNLATNVQNIFTAAKLVAIAIIVCGGAYKLILGNNAAVILFILNIHLLNTKMYF